MRFLMGLAVGGRRDGMYTDAVLNGVAVGGRRDGMIHTVTSSVYYKLTDAVLEWGGGRGGGGCGGVFKNQNSKRVKICVLKG